jgi:hypothetical protein
MLVPVHLDRLEYGLDLFVEFHQRFVERRRDWGDLLLKRFVRFFDRFPEFFSRFFAGCAARPGSAGSSRRAGGPLRSGRAHVAHRSAHTGRACRAARTRWAEVIVVAMMAPRTAVFGEGGKGFFDFLLLGLQSRTGFAARLREGSRQRVASGLKFFDLGFVEGVVAEVKTADRPAAQRHADLPADPCGTVQAPSRSVPVALVVLALNVLAVNSASLVSAVRQRHHRRGSGRQGTTCSKNGQNSTGRKHSKPPPVVEAAPRRRRLHCRSTRQAGQGRSQLTAFSGLSRVSRPGTYPILRS